MKIQYLLAILSTSLFFTQIVAQESNLEFDDFIEQHQGLDNKSGEIIPIGISEIERKINFFIEEKFPDLLENIDNILWDSYDTYSTNSNITHYHTFVAVLKIVNNLDLKFYEIIYYPHTKTVKSEYDWSEEQKGFVFDPSLEAREGAKPDLLKLDISIVSSSPSLADFNDTHNGFSKLKLEKNKGQNNFVPLDIKKINEMVSKYINSTYPEVQYTRNIIWKSYQTYVSPYSRYHFHVFIAQVKVVGFRRVKYLEVFYNPLTNVINGDFEWNGEQEKFMRPMNDSEK
tara:strand:- start:17940 stop:18797 length:858 start_codon:yes stop_codon:yes gene_type:complete